MKYERITMREFAGVTGDNIYNRLAELEDKIENGELISTVQSEQSEQEIAFFVRHNAEVRKQAVKEFVMGYIERLLAGPCKEDEE